MSARKFNVRCPKCGRKISARDELEAEDIAANGCSSCLEEEDEEEEEEEEEYSEDYEDELFDEYEDLDDDEYN